MTKWIKYNTMYMVYHNFLTKWLWSSALDHMTIAIDVTS